MIIIGLTGGIGSGKSTAAALLEAKGARVISADRVGHEIYKAGSEGWRKIVEAFGPQVVGADGEIDRKRLGQIVFSDPQALKRLNAITGPLIRSELMRRLEEEREAGTEVLVIEAALLVDADWHDLVDEVWAMTVPSEVAIERAMLMHGRSREQVESIMRSQLKGEEREKHAQVVIENSGSVADLERRLDKLWQELKRRANTAQSPTNVART